MRATLEQPVPLLMLTVVLCTTAMLGLATIPRQLALLAAGLPAPADPLLVAQQEALRAGLVRLMVMDRLAPQPAVLLGAAFLFLTAGPVLMLARDNRGALAAVIVLGLAPLAVDRIGELGISYLLTVEGAATAGDAIRLPYRFETGPLVFWRDAAPAPLWLELLDARVNLASLWCVALWSVGVQQLDGGRWAPWHVALPAACLAGAGFATYAVAPLVVPVIMR
jgi:hypothetical protein